MPRRVQVDALKIAIRNERRIYLMLVRAWERKMVQWRHSFSVSQMCVHTRTQRTPLLV